MALFMLPVERRRRHFQIHRLLEDVSDTDLLNYRFPRNIINDIVRAFDNSRFANSTERSNAMNSETQVSRQCYGKLQTDIIISDDFFVSKLTSCIK